MIESLNHPIHILPATYTIASYTGEACSGSPLQGSTGKWKNRIRENTDAKTETETNPEVDILTGSATGSDTGSGLFYFFLLAFVVLFFCCFFYFLFLPFFTSYFLLPPIVIFLSVNQPNHCLKLNSGLLL